MDTGDKSRLVGMKTAYAVVGGHSSDDFVTTKESQRFPEMPALPPLVSMHAIKLSSHISKELYSMVKFSSHRLFQF